jgi:signal transduction histidine kinase
VSAVVGLCLAFFILINNRRTALNVTFAALLFFGVIFIISHVIGVNVTDPNVSRGILMFNLVNFIIPVFNLHAVLALTGKTRERRGILVFLYVIAIALIIFFIIFPDLFLLPSVPKMYFPNYYNPGILNWTRVAFLFVTIIPYALYELASAFGDSKNIADQNRYRYLFIAMVIGYPVVFIPNLLVYNIPVDPLWGMWFFLFCAFPLMYGAVKYELFDVKVVAKQAFAYSVGIAVVGGFISLFDFINEKIRLIYPEFPAWVTPFSSAIIVVTIAFIIWKRLRESDILKSEFITVVTHKFRTPLTQIRWATENISADLPASDRDTVSEIQQANYRLIDLTNLLVQLSDTDTVDFNYHIQPQRFDSILEDIKADYIRRAGQKNISISFTGVSSKNVLVDEGQIRFVLQTLFDNALSYTPEGGSIKAELKEEKDKNGVVIASVLSITDSGMGFSKEEIGRLFHKFWRSQSALKADTEGMGIGLFMAKRIVERQHGTLRAESSGSNKGATFFLRLPISG